MDNIGNQNGQLKKMALSAKQRMKSGYWTQEKIQRADAVEESVKNGKDPNAVQEYLASRCNAQIKASINVHAYTEEKLYNKVCRILDENMDAINPIAQFMDKDYYETLGPTEKSRYVLVMMTKYCELKERYMRENNLIKSTR